MLRLQFVFLIGGCFFNVLLQDCSEQRHKNSTNEAAWYKELRNTEKPLVYAASQFFLSFIRRVPQFINVPELPFQLL